MIAHKLQNRIEYNKKYYKVMLYHDVILRIIELQRDGLFDAREKIILTAEMLAGRKTRRLTLEQKSELCGKIFSEFVNPNDNAEQGGQKIVDFSQDAPYIYASFIQAYGINLQRERLDWREFLALFQGLPSNTKIREIMEIRGKPLPKPTKYNQEEIRALQCAKSFYMLKIDPQDAETNFQAGLDKLATKLEQQAISAAQSRGE